MRALLAVARGVVLALLCVAPASAASPLAGNWSSTIDWNNQAAGLYQVMALTANGQIHVHVMNHRGMAFDMFGTYKMDPTGKTMRFTWTSYAPKQICAGGNCTPMRSPYVSIWVERRDLQTRSKRVYGERACAWARGAERRSALSRARALRRARLRL